MKVKYTGRKPVPVLVGVELRHVEGDVFETDTPEKLPACFEAVDSATARDPEPDQADAEEEKPKSSKKSRKRNAGGES